MKPMNSLVNAVLPRTLLIHRQYTELAKAFKAARVPFILLKGIALIECFPELMPGRNMEDMDILVPPEKLETAKKLLETLGYWPAPQDPSAHIHTSQPVAVDLIDRLWYLNEREHNELWLSGSKQLPDGGRVLNPVDFYLHVFAHGAIHHANTDAKWRSDLAIIDSRWHVSGLPLLNQKLRLFGWEELYKWLLFARPPHGLKTRLMLKLSSQKSGHIARVLMLRRKMLAEFLAGMFFPSDDFISGRYNIHSAPRVLAWRLARPFVLCKDAVCTASKLFFHQ